LGILKEIRALPAAIHRLTAAVQHAGESAREAAPFEARIDQLERTLAVWEAKMEAELLKADSTYKSAANAESRARTMQRNYEKLVDPFNLESETERDTLSEGDGARGEGEGVLPLRMDMEEPAYDPKQQALRAKFL